MPYKLIISKWDYHCPNKTEEAVLDALNDMALTSGHGDHPTDIVVSDLIDADLSWRRVCMILLSGDTNHLVLEMIEDALARCPDDVRSRIVAKQSTTIGVLNEILLPREAVEIPLQREALRRAIAREEENHEIYEVKYNDGTPAFFEKINVGDNPSEGVKLGRAVVEAVRGRNSALIKQPVAENLRVYSEHMLGLDFSNLNLRGVFLNTDLHGCVFNNTNLDEASLAGCTFLNSMFNETSFRKSDLTGCNFGGAYFSDTTLTRANLTRVNFASAIIASVKALHCNFRGAIFDDAEVTILSTYGSSNITVYHAGRDVTVCVMHDDGVRTWDVGYVPDLITTTSDNAA